MCNIVATMREAKGKVKAYVIKHKWVFVGALAGIVLLFAAFGANAQNNTPARCLPVAILEEKGAAVDEYPRWIGVSRMGNTGIIIMQSVKGDHFTVFRVVGTPQGALACVIDEGNEAEVLEFPPAALGSPS